MRKVVALFVRALFVLIFPVALILGSCSSNKVEVYAYEVKQDSSKHNERYSFKDYKSKELTPSLNLFVDITGSMDGYMCDGSQLKDAVFDYLSCLERYVDTTKYFYVHNRVIPITFKSSGDFIDNLNPTSFRKAAGTRSQVTDMAHMFRDVVERTDDSTVSVFITDCILDLPDSKNTLLFQNNCQIQIRNAISDKRKKDPDFCVEILKMDSKFEGNYCYPNGGAQHLPPTGVDEVKRPYYIWIFGDRDILAKLNRDIPFSRLEKFGLREILVFAPQTQVPYMITNNKQTGSEMTLGRNGYNPVLSVNLSSTLQPENVIQGLSYRFSDQRLTLGNKISPIKDKNSRYTHVLNITIPKNVMPGDFKLYLNSPGVPSWVSELNDAEGVDILNNLEKTTGIKSIIEGVYEAYSDEDVLAEFDFSISRKITNKVKKP